MGRAKWRECGVILCQVGVDEVVGLRVWQCLDWAAEMVGVAVTVPRLAGEVV